MTSTTMTADKTLEAIPKSAPQARLESIDILRGIVIVLMAIDHVRDFWMPTGFGPENLARTTAALFFTRWITHFCAPVFVLLAGTGAFLFQNKRGDKQALSRFLLTRGAWLMVLEVAVVSPSWFLDAPPAWVANLQVIWVIGLSMVLLAGLIWLPRWALLGFTLILIGGHNLLDGIQLDQLGGWKYLWSLLHVQRFFPVMQGSVLLMFYYPLIPWVAVMATGYLLGPVFLMEESRRHRWLYALGLAGIALFIVLRTSNFYGDPGPWSIQERGPIFTLLSFLRTEKYPPSLLFLCMTLGPALIALPLLERIQNRLSTAMLVFGQVPLFFYVFHVPLIHGAARIYNVLRYGSQYASTWFYWGPNRVPSSYEPSLLLMYGVWIIVVVLMYFPCRWYCGQKRTKRKVWMSYL